MTSHICELQNELGLSSCEPKWLGVRPNWLLIFFEQKAVAIAVVVMVDTTAHVIVL